MSGNPVAGKLDIVGSNLFSYVYAVVGDGDKTVLKTRELWCQGKLHDVRPLGDESGIINEANVNRALGEHVRIIKFYGLEEIRPNVPALRLERSHMGAVRKYILDHLSRSKAPSVASRARMALDFAEGLGHCHARGVRCGDFSTRNGLLFDGLRVKLCHFGAFQTTSWMGGMLMIICPRWLLITSRRMSLGNAGRRSTSRPGKWLLTCSVSLKEKWARKQDAIKCCVSR